MRNLLLALLTLLILTACDNAKEEQLQRDAQIAKKIRAEMLMKFEAEQKAQKIAFEKKLLEMSALKKIKSVEKSVKTTPPIVETIKIETTKREAPQDDSKLTQMGITITQNSISIDTNKTKTYINEISNNIDKKMQKISEDLSKGIIQTKEAGIDINEKHIHIDLNKTQNLIEDWGNKVKLFVNQFDEMAKTIDTNHTK